jgi:Na+/proline symporter
MTDMSEGVFFIVVLFSILAAPLMVFFVEKQTSFKKYIGSGVKYNWLYLSASTTGTIVGGGMFLGVGAMGFEAGVLGFIIGIVYLVGLGLLSAFAPKIAIAAAQLGVQSLSGAIKEVYGDLAVRIFGFVNLVIFLSLIAAQLIAVFTLGKYLMDRLENDVYIWILIVLAVLVSFSYSLFGGFVRDILSDIVQFSILLFSLIVLSIAMISNMNFAAAFESLPPNKLNGMGYGFVFLVGILAFVTPLFLVRSDMWQRAIAAKTHRDSSLGFWISGVFSLLFYGCFTLIGIFASFYFQDAQAEIATLEVLPKIVGTGIWYSIVIGSFFAAVLSSADTFLNNAGIHLHSCLYPENIENGKLVNIKICTFLVALVSFCLAYAIEDIVDLLVGSLSLLLIFGPGILHLLHSQKKLQKTFISSISIPFFVFLAMFFFGDPKIAFVVPVVLSVLIFWSGAWLANRVRL